jgi:hypothetical protein
MRWKKDTKARSKPEKSVRKERGRTAMDEKAGERGRFQEARRSAG